MAQDIEMQGLEFKIVNDSAAAVNGLESLVDTLTRLKTAISGGTKNLSKTAQGITEIANSVRGLNGGEASQKIASLSKALTSLRQLGNVNISSSFSKQLTAINTALSGLKWTDGDKLLALAAGLRPLSALGKAQLSSFTKQLGELANVSSELEKVDIDKFTRQMKELAVALKPLADEMQKVSNGFSAFPSKIQKLLNSTKDYNNAVGKARKSTGLWGKVTSALKFTGVTVALHKLGSMLGDAAQQASEWEGIAARFSRAFGDSAQENYEWIKKLSSEMHINTQQFMQYSSIFGTMLKGYGVAAEDAAKMAMGYTELAYDIYAGTNDIYKSFEDAAIAVRSAIAGEVEPIRAAGFTIVDSQLKITAANHGVAYSAQGASEELKSYLRYLTMVDQAKAQGLIGTYATELNTMEGLIRTLKQQIIQLGQSIGGVLLPVLARVLPYIQAFVSLISDAVAAIARLFGVELRPIDFPKGVSDSAEAAGELTDNLKSAGVAAKKLKQYTLGFDELHVISPDTGSGSGGGVAGGGYDGKFDISKVWDESIFAKINTQVAELKQKLLDILPIVAAIAGGLLGLKFSDKILSAIDKLKALKPKDIEEFFTNLKKSIGIAMAFAGAILLIVGAFDAWNNGVDWKNLLEMVGGVALLATGLYLALGPTAAAIGLIVGGIALLVIGIREWIKEGELTTPVFAAIAGGITAIGIAIAILTANPIALLIAGIAVGALLIIKNWDTIKEFFSNLWENIKTKAVEIWTSIGNFFKTKIPEIIKGIVNWFKELPGKIGEAIGRVLGTLAGWAVNIATWVATNIPKIIDSIVNWFKELPGKIWEKLVSFKDTIVEWKNKCIDWFSENIPKILNSITDWFGKLPDALLTVGENLIKGLWNGIVAAKDWFLEKLSSFFGGAWELISDFFSGVGSGFKEGYNSVPKFASGGFVSSGQLFIAREAGAEMVGGIGNRAAVANNDQIVAGIAQGVYEAVMAAMSESGGNQTIENVMYLDGEVVWKNQQKVARNRGYNFEMGAFTRA
mgnify:CR=1 FL=1